MEESGESPLKTCRKPRIIELIEFDREFVGSSPVIGVDEAGRGPLAGPVTACALYFPKFTEELAEILKFLDDSKKFSSNPKLRKELAEEIKKQTKYAICECSVDEIDKYNILQASLLAMKRACQKLTEQINSEYSPKILIDGKFVIPNYKTNQLPVIKGDSKSASIAAASILAKVHRDELMCRLSEQHPVYLWKKNKGYPTKAHIQAIREHGACGWHRKSFLKKVLD